MLSYSHKTFLLYHSSLLITVKNKLSGAQMLISSFVLDWACALCCVSLFLQGERKERKKKAKRRTWSLIFLKKKKKIPTSDKDTNKHEWTINKLINGQKKKLKLSGRKLVEMLLKLKTKQLISSITQKNSWCKLLASLPSFKWVYFLSFWLHFLS